MNNGCVDHGRKGNSGGYAISRYRDATGYVRQTSLHRVVYCKANNLQVHELGSLVVRHKCDNPRCINPDHLEAGTSKDNCRDMYVRGRANTARPSGTANKLSKLTEEQRGEVIALNQGGMSQYKLAVKFGVSRQLIQKIIYNGG